MQKGEEIQQAKLRIDIPPSILYNPSEYFSAIFVPKSIPASFYLVTIRELPLDAISEEK